LTKGGRGAGIVQQCPLQIHGANTRISCEQFVTGLSRTKEDFDVVRSLPMQQGLFLLCRDEQSQVVQLCMGDLKDEMAVLSTREGDHWAIDAATAEAGDDPVRFVNLYHAYRKAEQQREPVA
jgi:type IV secretion system protein VirB4